MEEAKDLRQQASIADRQKLDEYLESVRDVQVRIARELNPPKASWVPVNEPDYKRPSDGIPRNRDEHLRLIIDLMVLALQTDTTRVGTLMTAHGFSRQNFSFLDGVSSDHMVCLITRNSKQPSVNTLRSVAATSNNSLTGWTA